MDPKKPEASALAARGDLIVAVGSDSEIAPLIGERTRVIDLEGRLAVPGFIESHAHFTAIGKAKLMLDLKGARSWNEIVEKVKQAATRAPEGSWITGRGWHQKKWETPPAPQVRELPTHDALSEAAPTHPVLLTHASGHLALVNGRAMELAGIDRNTPDPEGGEIVRDAHGDPTGALRETAVDFITRVREKSWNEGEERRAMQLAASECLSRGITTLHDAGARFREIDLYRQLVREDGLGLRLWVMIDGEEEALATRMDDYRIVGAGGRTLTVRAVKMYIDGALGSHGAWLFEPYADLPGESGDNTLPLEELERTARLAIEKGFQLCTHAIGDRANHEVLDVYERVFKAYPGKSDLRWRIEHAQHLQPADIPRFASLGVIAAMQGVHCTSDGPWVIERLGEKRAREGAYAWRALLDSGATVTNGTDAPVEDVDPISCFFSSVTRMLPAGTAFFPEQRMSREEALRSYTTSAAYAAFEENVKGSLIPGKLADITVLSRDIMTIAEEEIPGTVVLFTIVGGKIAYQL
jgi:predicted amidohydrolase YtcJ